MLTLPFLVLLLTSLTIETDIQITKLENPILPINLGNAKLIYNHHTFLHYVDLKEIIIKLNNIEKYFLVLKNHLNFNNITNSISYHGLAENLLLRTEYLIKITSEKLNNLHPHIRKERALLNIVGKANKWLFGSLDSDDGERYNNAISVLQTNQKSINKELKLQISLSKDLIVNYNKTISILSKNQETFQTSLNLFQKSVQDIINNVQDYLSLQGIITQLNLDCQNLIIFLDNLEDAITFAKVNALHNSILPSFELINMLKYLSNIYEKSNIPNFRNTLSYYQFLGTDVKFIDNRIIFAIHIPILRAETLSFYHIYPIIQSQTLFIPRYPYLALSERRKQFSTEACPVIEDVYFCLEEFHPDDQCVIELLETNQINNCPTMKINIEDPISEQITQELVLILPSKPIKLIAKCETDHQFQINESILVKIPVNCEIEVNQKKFFNDVKIQDGKPLILPEIKLTGINTTKTLILPNITKINFDEIYKLKDMANQLIPPIELTTNNQSSILNILISICFILIIVLIIIRRKKIALFWRSIINKSKKKKIGPHSKTTSVIFES